MTELTVFEVLLDFFGDVAPIIYEFYEFERDKQQVKRKHEINIDIVNIFNNCTRHAGHNITTRQFRPRIIKLKYRGVDAYEQITRLVTSELYYNGLELNLSNIHSISSHVYNRMYIDKLNFSPFDKDEAMELMNDYIAKECAYSKKIKKLYNSLDSEDEEDYSFTLDFDE